MDGQGSLRDALAILDQEIETREKELGELRAARRHLVALVPQESLLEEQPAGRSAGMRLSDLIGPSNSASRIPPGSSIPDAAAIIIKDAARPMPSDAIARAMLARGHKYDGTFNTLVDTVRGVLGREVRRGRTFERFGRGQFGLAEWKPAELAEHVELGAEDEDGIRETA